MSAVAVPKLRELMLLNAYAELVNAATPSPLRVLSTMPAARMFKPRT